jgi:hypothetical protein
MALHFNAALGTLWKPTAKKSVFTVDELMSSCSTLVVGSCTCSAGYGVAPSAATVAPLSAGPEETRAGPPVHPLSGPSTHFHKSTVQRLQGNYIPDP